MLLFGHLGITLGAGLAGYQICSQVKKHTLLKKASSVEKRGLEAHVSNTIEKPQARFKSNLIMVLFCIIGSMLPDIIDKPVGHYLFGQLFGYNGRIFSHTLLFAFVVLDIGLFFYLIRKNILGLVLSYGVFMHLILDSMWLTPATLFWPAFGLEFPRFGEYDFALTMIRELFSNPIDYIPEIIGITILAIWAIWY
jgi:membrane-bound metal-dependent hydrolase YbcI (DUF457 family)